MVWLTQVFLYFRLSQTTPADVERLNNQIDFLKDANAALADNFTRYVDTVNASLTVAGFVLTAITLLGTVVFGKSLWDFRRTLQGVNQEVENRVRQRVEQEVALVVQSRIDKLEAILAREVTLSRVSLCYILPTTANDADSERVAFALRVLNARGFNPIPRYLPTLQTAAQGDRLPNFSQDVVVLDMASTTLPDASKEEIVANTLAKVPRQQAALVVYSPGRFEAISKGTADGHYCSAANSPLTLVARVTEAGYVADAIRQS